jgi:hypothetical protein
MQKYLNPPKTKIFNGDTYELQEFVGNENGFSHEQAREVASELRFGFGREYSQSIRIVGFKAPNHIYSEGKVYFLYERV